jgi:glycosyltransferase 2 family protein
LNAPTPAANAGGTRSKTRSLLLNLGRIVLSIALLAWILSTAGLAQLAEVARRADLRLYGLALAVAFAGICVRSLRWQWLLKAVGANVPFRRVVYLYFIGSFFNTFLPTGFGGDVVRVLEIGPGATSDQAAGTALVDRLTGFIILFVLALVTLPFSYRRLPPNLTVLISLMAVAVLGGSALLFEGRLLRRLTVWLPRSLSLAGDAWIGKTYAVITACGRRGVVGALFWSLVFNLLQVFANVLVARALGVTVSAWVFFMIVPLATAVLLVPISISGFGVREGLYVALFGQLGVGAALALALSLATYALDFSTGLFGGLVYFGAGLLGLRRKQ